MIPQLLFIRQTMRSFTGEETELGVIPIARVFTPPTVQTEADREVRYFEDQYNEIVYSEVQYNEPLYNIVEQTL